MYCHSVKPFLLSLQGGKCIVYMNSFDKQDVFYSYSLKLPSLATQSRGTLEHPILLFQFLSCFHQTWANSQFFPASLFVFIIGRLINERSTNGSAEWTHFVTLGLHKSVFVNNHCSGFLFMPLKCGKRAMENSLFLNLVNTHHTQYIAKFYHRA